MCKDLTPTDVTDLGSAIQFLMEDGTITDTADTYGEPGYRLDNPNGVLLFGDWWCRDKDCDYTETYDGNLAGQKKCHEVELHYARLFSILEAAGAEFHFYDEWWVDYNTGKAYRTEADSYSWQSSIMWCEDYGDFLTPDDDVSLWVDAVVNNPRSCIPAWIDDAALADLGYVERECGYESGWYGQEDNPEAILKAIRENEPEADVVFKLDRVEQFRVTFCTYVKSADEDEDQD